MSRTPYPNDYLMELILSIESFDDLFATKKKKKLQSLEQFPIAVSFEGNEREIRCRVDTAAIGWNKGGAKTVFCSEATSCEQATGLR